jgi:hypothetical protein
MDIRKDYIEYRSFNGVNVPIMTIPKGSLLFRLVYNSEQEKTKIDKMMKESFLGLTMSKPIRNFNEEVEFDEDEFSFSEAEEEFCLHNNHNVFFYPYPYVMDTNWYIRNTTESKMVLFETTKDIKVALFLSPSGMTRINKGMESVIATTCDNFSFCDDKKGRDYDPCFKYEFMEKFPDVVGMYSIQQRDSKRFLDVYKTANKFKPFKKFIHFYKDSKTIGIPELILYPLQERSLESLYNKINLDAYEYITGNENDYNYKVVEVFDHEIYEKDKLFTYMSKQKDYIFNQGTGFYERKI